ncbi:MAG: hypothetical protein J2P46_21735, partial [Zavarzinella sp.]|nr:hypothetical protein [Zavarzinella sp.]
MLWALGLQQDNDFALAGAFAGGLLGRVVAAIVCGGIPITVGNYRGNPGLGGIGGVVSGVAAFLFTCVLGVPLTA